MEGSVDTKIQVSAAHLIVEDSVCAVVANVVEGVFEIVAPIGIDRDVGQLAVDARTAHVVIADTGYDLVEFHEHPVPHAVDLLTLAALDHSHHGSAHRSGWQIGGTGI